MISSVFIGASGMQSYSTGLKVISNNVANLNTPGFKSSEVRFVDLFYQPDGSSTGAGTNLLGTGVMAGQTFVNFKAGDTRLTGNPLDLSVSGDGYFATRGVDGGPVTYTRAGQFEFDPTGTLVSRSTGRQVVGLGSGGVEAPVSLNGLRLNPPRPTSLVKLTGNLSTDATDFALDAVKVIDAAGGEHTLGLAFKSKPGTTGAWMLRVMDGETEIFSTEIQFVAGSLPAGSDTVTFSYAPSGVSSTDVKLDLSANVTSFSTGSTSTLAVSSSDGHPAGALTQVTFDAKGRLVLAYSNGEKTTGQTLALAVFDVDGALTPIGAGEFEHPEGGGMHLGRAGEDRFGDIASSQIEVSNVDLSAEFSDLIVMQRGYQASSRLISTANDMLQDLFDMKGHR